MLFDLSGKRRNVVRVVYAFLAIIFMGGFLFFGIGSDVQGGLGDLFGFGTNDTSTAPQYEEQIDDAEEAIEEDPQDEQAYVDLILARFSAGNQLLGEGEDSKTLAEAEDHYLAATAAWESYLEITDEPKYEAASISANAYQRLFTLFPPEIAGIKTFAKGAVGPAEIVAEEIGGINPYLQLAQYAYFAGDTKLGDEASEKALAEADSAEKKQLEKVLASLAKAPAELEKQLAAQNKADGKGDEETDSGAFANPLAESGFGGGAAPATPTAPPAP